MCLQQDREAKARERDGHVPDAPADVLEKVPLPPAGSLVRVASQLPQGTELPWLPKDVRRVGPVRSPARCCVEGCDVKFAAEDVHESGTCAPHRKGTIVHAMRPTGFEPESWCDNCKGWRPAEGWPLLANGKRRSRCRPCFERAEAKKAMKKGAAVDGAVDVVKDAPAPGVVVEEIKRKGHVRGAPIKRAEAGAERSGGLLWMSDEPIRIPAPDAAPADDATRSENRVRGAGKATHTCRVHGCDNDAMGKFVCPTHAGVVVHEEVAAGECAQQRYCRRCQGMKNAFGFKPDGACGEKCPLITAGRGDRRRKGPGYINRVLAGVAWPADAGAPSLQQCRDVAALMGVGLLHHDHGAAGGGCCHETQGGERCGAACVADQRVCATHLGTVAVSTEHAGLVWTCPECHCEKPLEARGAGVCRACYAATGARACDAATAARPRTEPGCSHTPDADDDCVMVDDVTAAEAPQATPGQGVGPDEPAAAVATGGAAPAPLGVVCFGDSDTDPDDAGGGHAREPQDIRFRVGGSRPKQTARPVPAAGQRCSADGCTKVLSGADGHGGRCFTCLVSATQFASPIDLLALLLVPGALKGGQGVLPTATDMMVQSHAAGHCVVAFVTH